MSNNYIPPSMQGKHDRQLEKELEEALLKNGISPWVQIERRRAKIKVKLIEGNTILIRNTVCSMFPEFAWTETSCGSMTFKPIF